VGPRRRGATSRQLIIARGAVTAEQVDAALALFDDTTLTGLSRTIIAAWGRSAG
jgi:hypothetical protein